MGDTHVLDRARNVRIENSSLTITTNNYAHSDPDSSIKALQQRVALNAINNDGGRADEPKCHPGTRTEVLEIIEKWADDPTSNRILWLSGPAGGGKTAIMKTITERAAARGAPTVNFFFFRADPTRCDWRPVVPTLLYQILRRWPELSPKITQMLDAHPLILDASISEQCTIIAEIASALREPGAPIILVIDGLDECNGGERARGDLLRAFAALVSAANSPIRLLIASRPEPHIQMAFNQLTTPTQTIFLDEHYSPAKDIRFFVIQEFRKIKSSHPMAHLLPTDWPAYENVDFIVVMSSGQFIYAATVMRYLADPLVSPHLSLERVKGIIPGAINNSPFRYLDAIYTFILSHSDDLEATRDLLSVHLASRGSIPDMQLFPLLNPRYNRHVLESCASRISSVIKITEGGFVRFHHASFLDFIVNPSRAGIYCIDVQSTAERVFLALWDKPPIPYPDGHTIWQETLLVCLRTPVNSRITRLLCGGKYPEWTTMLWPNEDRPGHDFLYTVALLYCMAEIPDLKSYLRILHAFIPVLVSRHPAVTPDMYKLDYVGGEILRYKRYGIIYQLFHAVQHVFDT